MLSQSFNYRTGALFLGLLLLVGIVFHFVGLTLQVVDQIYCRSVAPWSNVYQPKFCSPFRSGDDIFENEVNARELARLSQNPYQQSFSERIAAGYSIRDAYASNPYTLFQLLSYWLPTSSSINFSGLLLLGISSVLGFYIGHALGFRKWYALSFAILYIPMAFVGLYESVNWGLLGMVCIGLALINWYKGRTKPFFLFALLGSTFILLSSIFQFYLYVILSLVAVFCYSFFSSHKEEIRRPLFYVTAIFIALTFLFWGFLEGHFVMLVSSNKFANDVTFFELVLRKGYSLDPVGWTSYYLPLVHRQVITMFFGKNAGANVAPFMTGIFSPGAAYLVFCFLGLWALRKRFPGYVAFTFFWFLYYVGVVSFLLSIIPYSPFRNETSLRAGYLFFFLGNVAAVYALREFLQGRLRISPRLRTIIIACLAYIALLCVVFIGADVFLFHFSYPILEVIYGGISALLLIIVFFLRRKNGNLQSLVVTLAFISILLPTLGRLFLGATPAVFTLSQAKWYFPQTAFTQLFKTSGVSRVALIKTPNGSMTHETGPLFLGEGTISAYRNPLDKKYSELYHYHQLLFSSGSFEGAALPSRFMEFKKSKDYIENFLSPWQAKTKEISLSFSTKRYLALHGVDGIIGSSDLIICDLDWRKVGAADGLSLWQSKAPPPFFFAVSQRVLPKDEDQLMTFFNDESWDIKTQALVKKDYGIAVHPALPKAPHFSFSLVKKTDGYRLIRFQTDTPGILTFPVTYNVHWQATSISKKTNIPLQTFTSNYAFLGVAIPAGKGLIEVVYRDKIKTYDWILAGMGGILLVAEAFLIFKKIYE